MNGLNDPGQSVLQVFFLNGRICKESACAVKPGITVVFGGWLSQAFVHKAGQAFGHYGIFSWNIIIFLVIYIILSGFALISIYQDTNFFPFSCYIKILNFVGKGNRKGIRKLKRKDKIVRCTGKIRACVSAIKKTEIGHHFIDAAKSEKVFLVVSKQRGKK